MPRQPLRDVRARLRAARGGLIVWAVLAIVLGAIAGSAAKSAGLAAGQIAAVVLAGMTVAAVTVLLVRLER